MPMPRLCWSAFLVALLLFAGLPVASLVEDARAQAPPTTCPNGQPPAAIDLGTGEQGGVPDPLGAKDNRWSLLATPTGGATDAYSITASPPPYGAAFPWVKSTQANWISPFGAGTGFNDPAAPAGTYTYATSFLLSPADSVLNLSISFAVDNTVEFFLNGAAIGGYTVYGTAAFNQWHTLAWTGGGFLPGTNTLEARVHNAGGYEGLIVRGAVHACDVYGGCSPIDLGTGGTGGVPDPLGAVDGRWSLLSTPFGGAAPAHSISATPAPYGAKFPWVKSTQANWISPYGAGTGANPAGAAAGTYRFVTTFSLTQPETASLLLRYATDNTVQFLLNGVPIGGFPLATKAAFSQWHTLAWATGFVTGANTLEARVANQGMYMGVIVEGAVSPCVPIPPVPPCVAGPGCLVPCAPAAAPPCPVTPPPCGVLHDPVLCPAPVAGGGAACVSHALVLVQSDGTTLVGDHIVNLSTSLASAAPVPGTPPTAGGDLSPLPAPAAQDHAAVVDVVQAASGVRVTAAAAHARCQATAVDGGSGVHAQAWGRAGVENLTVAWNGIFVGAKAAEAQAKAVGEPAATAAATTCDLAEVALDEQSTFEPTTPRADGCPPPNQILAAAGVEAILNEQWGPVQDAAGQWVYGTAAIHVRAVDPTGQVAADLYLGYVAVAVAGGPAAAPKWVAGLRPADGPECAFVTQVGLACTAGGNTNVDQVSVGHHGGCYVGAGDVECWSVDPHHGTALDRPGGDAVQVSTKLHHTCVLQSNGNVDCWGHNIWGQADDYEGRDAVAVDVGWDHSCFLRTGGNVHCHGQNSAGEANPYLGGDAVALASGSNHNCVLKSDGNVHCWGSNASGQLAGYTGGDAVAVSAGASYACALRATGDVACWGSNGYGQSTPYTGGDAVALTGGWGTTCVVRTNGNVDCWGRNEFGQAEDYFGGDAVAVSSGVSHTCVLRVSKTLHCWGLPYPYPF